MAKSTRGARKPAQRKQAQSSDVLINVPVPQNVPITVMDLKSLSERELNDVLEKAKTAQVGFIILNAPFKIPRAELAS